MDALARIEQSLASALAEFETEDSPPRLAAAVRHAVFAGGARIRPRLCLAVAGACGEDNPALTDAAAGAIELLHCASLVHDDLPCFDDAAMRRGKPSVHRAFDEPLAVLAGDALIVLAFQRMSRDADQQPQRTLALIRILGRAVGAPSGIVAGQAWECEESVALSVYQRAKTAPCSPAPPWPAPPPRAPSSRPWRILGEKIGEAYQVADDIRDALADPEEMGKPGGRDVALDRPSATRELGPSDAVKRFNQLVSRRWNRFKMPRGRSPQCPYAVGSEALFA